MVGEQDAVTFRQGRSEPQILRCIDVCMPFLRVGGRGLITSPAEWGYGEGGKQIDGEGCAADIEVEVCSSSYLSTAPRIFPRRLRNLLFRMSGAARPLQAL